MGGLAEALQRACRASGAEIAAKAVASSVDANRTFLHFVGDQHPPEPFVEQVPNIDYASASAKLNLALDGLPDFHTGNLDPQIALHGTTHLTPEMKYIERAFDDAKYGRPSDQPVLEVTIPSIIDDSLAPPGKTDRREYHAGPPAARWTQTA